MKEPIYTFSCGCSYPKSQTKPGRQIKCPNPEHRDADLIQRVCFCKVCGVAFETERTTGRAPHCCIKHDVKKRYQKVAEKKKTRVKPPLKTRYQRGKYHCRHFHECSQSSKINCINCDRFDAVFFGYDPKPLHDLIWAA